MNLSVEKASVKVLMAESFLLLKLCWPNKIWFCFSCGKTCQNIRRLVLHTHLGLPACSFHSTRIAGSSATVASDTGDVTLWHRVAFGEADKYACWRPGPILVITGNKGTSLSGKEEMIENCPAGKRDGALLPRCLFRKVSVVQVLVKWGLASW